MLPNIDRLLRHEVRAHFGWLEDLGYAPPVFETERGLLGTVIHASFRRPDRELLVGVVVEPAPLPGADRRHVSTMHLYLRAEDPDQPEALYVDWFAAVHRRDLSDRIESLAYDQTPIADYIRAVFPIYRELLEQDLRAVVEGREWIGGTGDPHVVRQFDFLVRDFGFSLPAGRQAGIQQNHIYTRGDVEVCVAWEGCDMLTIRTGGRYLSCDLPRAEAAAFLQAHPEVLEGDLGPFEALVRGRQP
jgi:hypothetical protein